MHHSVLNINRNNELASFYYWQEVYAEGSDNLPHFAGVHLQLEEFEHLLGLRQDHGEFFASIWQETYYRMGCSICNTYEHLPHPAEIAKKIPFSTISPIFFSKSNYTTPFGHACQHQLCSCRKSPLILASTPHDHDGNSWHSLYQPCIVSLSRVERVRTSLLSFHFVAKILPLPILAIFSPFFN